MLRLKELRERLGYSQAVMAQKIGIIQTTYQRYESGDRTPSYDILLRISETFDVSVDYLLGKNIIDAKHLSAYETELIAAARIADCRAKEDALLLLKSHAK